MKFQQEKLRSIVGLLDRAIEEEKMPGGTVAVGVGQETIFEAAVGWAEHLNGVERPTKLDTIYDLASLTKVTATLPSVLWLIDNGQLRLKDPVATFLPSFTDGGKDKVNVLQLLTHSAGLIWHKSFYELYRSPEEIREAIQAEPLVRDPGTAVVYSDLSFLLLAQIVEVVSGQTLDSFAKQHIFQPLGMVDTGYYQIDGAHAQIPLAHNNRIAATENNGPGGTVKVGMVHDENAAALNGVAGHAGLFAPLADVVRYTQMWLSDNQSVLSPAVRRLAVTCHTANLDACRGLGWVARGDAYDHTGDLWPETTVGHTGFTGTSIAFDPVSKLWAVLLTNRVHYGREHTNIIRLRNLVHNVIAASVTDLS